MRKHLIIRQIVILFSMSCLINFIFTTQIYAQEKQTENKELQDKCINIKKLKFKGNKSFTDIRLKMRMKTWHSSFLPGSLNCCNEEWLKLDIIRVIEFYRKQGFPDVEIDYLLIDSRESEENKKLTENIKPLKNKELGIIEINIDEGFKYEISFKGNNFFSNKELAKKIDLVKKGNADDTALSRAKVDIKKLYLDMGFQDISVDFYKTKRGLNENDGKNGERSISGIWDVQFAIDEGTRTIVNSLKINGNKNLSEKEIMDAMLTRQKGTFEKGGYNESELDKDINAVELLYLSKGFLNAAVNKNVKFINNISVTDNSLKIEEPAKLEESKKLQESTILQKSTKSKQLKELAKQKTTTKSTEPTLVNIEININEGVQTVIGSLKIKGIDTITMQDSLKKLSLKPKEPFREYMVKSDENTLSMIVSEFGYPHVKVKSNLKFNKDKSIVDLEWHIEKGLFTQFGDIKYSGNTRLKQDIIKNRLDIETGKPFSLKKIFTSEKKLRESPAVKYVQIKAPALAQMEKAPDIEVNIEETKPYFIEAAAGYDTEQNFYIDTKLGDNNFYGREIDAWVSASISGIGYKSEIGLKKPFFLGTKIDADSNIYIEDKEELNKNFGVKSWGYETGFARELFTKNIMAGLNLQYENRTVYGDADIDTQEKESRNILITSFAAGYDSRDSAIKPVKGFLSSASVDLYTGFDTDLDRFVKYQLDLRKYISPFSDVTFAFRTRFGYIQPFGTGDSVAQDQLFFLGGTSNVRGFKENMLEYDYNGSPVGGRSELNSTLEARIELPADFELNCFLDAGKIDKLSTGVESRGFRSSAGLGLRYITPVGPIGLLYGHKLDTEDGENPGRFHFSVGYTF